jgi:hypothetical protein
MGFPLFRIQNRTTEGAPAMAPLLAFRRAGRERRTAAQENTPIASRSVEDAATKGRRENPVTLRAVALRPRRFAHASTILKQDNSTSDTQ